LETLKLIIDRPAIDWLTLTTFDYKSWKEGLELARYLSGSGYDSELKKRWKQYHGRGGEQYFAGETLQAKGTPHFMLRLSGDLSDLYMGYDGKPPTLDCTRIDVQLTTQTVMPLDALRLVYRDAEDALLEHEAGRKQYERAVELQSSKTGYTLYIGARAGDGKFYRIYVKGMGDLIFNRFEVECKGKEAISGPLYRVFCGDPIHMGRFLAGELTTLPDDVLPICDFKYWMRHIGPDIFRLEKRIPDDMATIRWIETQVLPAWKRQLAMHDTRQIAQTLLNQLYDFSEALE
jgi:hypothetical protein